MAQFIESQLLIIFSEVQRLVHKISFIQKKKRVWKEGTIPNKIRVRKRFLNRGGTR